MTFLQVSDSKGNIVQFRIKPYPPLVKLKNAFCARLEIGPREIRFLIDRQHIRDDSTVFTLRMKDFDCIDAMPPEIG